MTLYDVVGGYQQFIGIYEYVRLLQDMPSAPACSEGKSRMFH
jgi:hypothetical protein